MSFLKVACNRTLALLNKLQWAGPLLLRLTVGLVFAYTGWGIAEQGGGGSLEGLKKLSREMDQIFAS